MKTLKYISVLAIASALVLSCDMDEIVPEGGTVLESQLQETINTVPARGDASFSGMYTKLGDPLSFGRFSSKRPDDFGFIMMAFSNDLEGVDIVTADNNYNWFSTCMEYSSRNADYANPYIRYRGCYDELGRANDLLKMYGEITAETSADIKSKAAQAYAIRAFCYLNLAPYYQFNYQIAADKPCVPIVTTEEIDFTNNPRATVKEVYDLIVEDLTTAIEYLDGYTRPDKSKIDQKVAYGLRARAYLDMGMYAEAAEDAAKAAEGYTPASIADVSKPYFFDINESNWLWGYDMTPAVAQTYPFATASAWIRSFSENGYAPGTQTYSCINNLLYAKIPESDVRKGWWVNEELYSPLLDGLRWNWSNADGTSGTFVGQEIATEESDNKLIYLPYTNVKFGCITPGTVLNEEDWPFMRVEEMLLIQAEALYRSGKEAEGKKVLSDFVKTYRDPEYNVEAAANFLDEVWFQRRVELWGEGFSTSDLRRLQKPFVRFHEGKKSNFPEAFQINFNPTDGWLLLRFCTDELNTNFGIVDNTEGDAPVAGQNGNLRDGVTD
ncbi:MAG: RagB/SusD family nutrient uptake outer membrane protein [Candidatus Cryptobacteroides sp.]